MKSFFALIPVFLFFRLFPVWGNGTCNSLLTNDGDPEKIQFFSHGAPAQNYGYLLSRLKYAAPGTVLDFGDGDTLTFSRYINSGGTHVIIENDEGLAIRIPIYNPQAHWGTDPLSFVTAHADLESAGIKVVGLNLQKSRPPKFLAVDRLKILFTLEDLKYEDQRLQLTRAERSLAIKRLIDFARSTWSYESLGDFNETQLGFDGNQWVLFDIAEPNLRIKNIHQSRHVFSPINYGEGYVHHLVSPEIQKKIDSAILNERAEQLEKGQVKFSKNDWFERDGSTHGMADVFFATDEEEISAGNHRERFIYGSYLQKWARKNLKFYEAQYEGSNLMSFRVQKILQVSDETVLYSVVVAVNPGKSMKGYIEVQLSLGKGKKSLFQSSFPLLTKRGFKQNDLDAIGPDYVLVLDH